MGRDQIAEGSNSLDICTAFVGRDEMFEMSEVIRRFTSSVNSPLVIDSTETPIMIGISRRMICAEAESGETSAHTPRINAMLQILEPTTFPIAIAPLS